MAFSSRENTRSTARQSASLPRVDADNVQISKDRDYQQADRKKGLLRWDVQVPAQKNGSDAFALSYKMHLEHDRNLAISTAGLLGPELKELLNF